MSSDLARHRDFLNRMLEGEVPTRSEIEQIAAATQLESHYLDFKSGKALECFTGAKNATNQKKIKEFKDELFKDVTGFANADGGVLVFGVDQHGRDDENPTFEHTGARVLGDPDAVFLGPLQKVFSEFQPPPRIVEVKLDSSHSTYLVAVGRAPQLIHNPTNKLRAPKAFLRFGKDTHPVPDSVYADLVLSRRSHPVFEVLHASVRYSWRPNGNRPERGARFQNREVNWVQFDIAWTVTNESYSQQRPRSVLVLPISPHRGIDCNLSQGLRREVHLPGGRDSAFYNSWDVGYIEPFQTARAGSPTLNSWVRTGDGLRCALGVAADGSPPQWHQLDFKIDRPFAGKSGRDDYTTLSDGGQITLKAKPVRSFDRPTVEFVAGPGPSEC